MDDHGSTTSPDLTARGLRILLESAVSAAKRGGRNKVVRFTEDARKAEIRSIRDNCGSCEVSFTLDLSVEDVRTDDLFCPNCGYRIVRPVLESASSPTPV